MLPFDDHQTQCIPEHLLDFYTPAVGNSTNDKLEFFLKNIDAQTANLMVQSANASIYSPREWGQALRVFFEKEASVSLKNEHRQIIGFIGCCAESGLSQAIDLPLKMIVEEYLETHGYEGVN